MRGWPAPHVPHATLCTKDRGGNRSGRPKSPPMGMARKRCTTHWVPVGAPVWVLVGVAVGEPVEVPSGVRTGYADRPRTSVSGVSKAWLTLRAATAQLYEIHRPLSPKAIASLLPRIPIAAVMHDGLFEFLPTDPRVCSPRKCASAIDYVRANFCGGPHLRVWRHPDRRWAQSCTGQLSLANCLCRWAWCNASGAWAELWAELWAEFAPHLNRRPVDRSSRDDRLLAQLSNALQRPHLPPRRISAFCRKAAIKPSGPPDFMMLWNSARLIAS
jgi:hypothetical protein